MKKITIIIIFLFFNNVFSQNTNYSIIIDNQSIDINLDKAYQFTTKKGEVIQFKVSQKDTLKHSDSFLDFKFYKEYSISNSKIEDGVQQLTLMTANGTAIIIQEYSELNPDTLIDLMLHEIVKESVNYGYIETRNEYKKKLKDGQIIKGKTSVLEYNGDAATYTAAAIGKKDTGILIITIIDNEFISEDQKVIDLFLDSLHIKI